MTDRPVKHNSERPWRAWPFAATLAVILGIALVTDTLSSIRGADASSYILLAKSIGEGYGFADINVPGAPPHTQYPPLFPLILSPLYAAFGYNFVMMRLVMLVISYGAVYMAGRYLERVGGTRIATAVAFLMATNFGYLFIASEFISEVPYVMISLVALYFLRKFGDRGGVRAYALILPAVVALTYMTRMIGVTLYAAVLVALAVEYIEGRADAEVRRRCVKRFVLFGVAAIIPFAVWSLRNSIHAGDVATYQSIFMTADYYSMDAGGAGVGTIVARFFHNSGYYIQAIPRSVITSIDFKGVVTEGPLSVIAVLMLLVILLGLARELWVKKGIKDYYFIIYFALLTVWPVYGSGDARRYVVPMIPFVYYYLIIGVSVLYGWRSAFKRNSGTLKKSRVMLGVAIVLMAMNVFEIRELLWPPTALKSIERGGGLIRQNLFKRVDVLTPAGAGAADYVDKVPCFYNYLHASDALSRAMGPDDVAVARKPEISYLLSGRHVIRFPYTTDHAEMSRFMDENNVTHLLLDACYRETDSFVLPYVLSSPDDYEIIADDKMGTAILRIKGRGAVPLPDDNKGRDNGGRINGGPAGEIQL